MPRFDSIPMPGYVTGDEAIRVWMRRVRALLLLAGCCLAAWATASESDWRLHRDAGIAAHGQGNHAEAVKQTELALAEAEAFGERDTRFAETLANLAFLYREAGRFDEAGRAFLRSISTWEADRRRRARRGRADPQQPRLSLRRTGPIR